MVGTRPLASNLAGRGARGVVRAGDGNPLN